MPPCSARPASAAQPPRASSPAPRAAVSARPGDGGHDGSPGRMASEGSPAAISVMARRTDPAVDSTCPAAGSQGGSASLMCHPVGRRPANAASRSARPAWRAMRFSQLRRTPAPRWPDARQISASSAVSTNSGTMPRVGDHRISVGLNDRSAPDSAPSSSAASPGAIRRTVQPWAAKPAAPSGGVASASPVPHAMTASRPSRHRPARHAASCTGPVASCAASASTQPR